VDNFPKTSPVGSFSANSVGLYDLGGNAYELCEDWYDSGQTFRVLRGGACDSTEPNHLWSSNRNYLTPDLRYIGHVGFRVVLVSVSSR
jgi:formylglycine-generating enzyme required for sulfatase activity